MRKRARRRPPHLVQACLGELRNVIVTRMGRNPPRGSVEQCPGQSEVETRCAQ